jgi:hypothetical protein
MPRSWSSQEHGAHPGSRESQDRIGRIVAGGYVSAKAALEVYTLCLMTSSTPTQTEALRIVRRLARTLSRNSRSGSYTPPAETGPSKHRPRHQRAITGGQRFTRLSCSGSESLPAHLFAEHLA